MNEELSAYTYDVNKKISLNEIGIDGFKDQTTDTYWNLNLKTLPKTKVICSRNS